MAFGFVKKIFSFGRKQVEEVPAPDAPALVAEAEAPESTRPTPGPARDLLPTGEESGAAAPAPPEPPPSAPEIPPQMPELETPKPEHEAVEPAPAPEPRPEPAHPPRPAPEPAPLPQEVPPSPEPQRPAPARPATPPREVPPPAEPAQPAPPATPNEPSAPPVEVPPAPEPGEPAPPEPEIPPQASAPHPAKNRKKETPASTPSTVIEGSAASAESPLVSLEAETPPPASPRPPEGEGKSEGPAPAVAETVPPPRSEGKVTVAKSVARAAEPEPAAPAPAAKVPWLQRLRQGLSRSSRELGSSISGVFTRRKLDEDTLQELEDVLIRADLGVETALRVTDALATGRYGRDVSDAEVRAVMAAEVEKVLGPVALPLELDLSHKPHVILVVGVNGTGKTTTIGKLAAKLTQGGLSVMLAAGDTFRAAAIEQLRIWGERTGSPVVSSRLGADAAGLAFDAFEKARQAGADVLIIDTAGRLQNRTELMAELEKIVRVLGKLDPEAPHTVLQTVDATTGQNALNQVEIFRNVAGVNGLVMTKLDGTARGGILVAIAARHRLPVYFIGVGEQVDDLEPFSAADFAMAIAGVEQQ